MAWTVTLTYETEYYWRGGNVLNLLRYNCTSDTGSSGDNTLSDDLNTAYGTTTGLDILDRVRGGTLYAVEYVPDATSPPTTEAQITVDTAHGTLIFDETVSTAGTPQMWSGAVDKGFGVPFEDLILASTTFADTKIADIYLWILK